MHCVRQKSQHLRLLFIEQYMNSNRVLPKRVKKKKKKKTQNADVQNVDPNIHLDSITLESTSCDGVDPVSISILI